MKKIVVAGGGVLGSQIAYQSAYSGFDVTIWLRSEGSITRTQPKLTQLRSTYREALLQMRGAQDGTGPAWCRGLADAGAFDFDESLERAEKAYDRIRLELDLARAAEDADLIIEAVAEDVPSKIAFYTALAPLLDEKTILVTNSSTLLPSQFAEYTGRPEKYLALHFANQIWRNNTAEIMGHAATSPAAFDAVVAFAQAIRMIPLPLKKEQPGYILNSMLVPFLDAGLDLLEKGIADPETIDKTWMLGTGAPAGPFRIMDVIGLTTVYNVLNQHLQHAQSGTPYNYTGMAELVKQYLDAGKLGVSSGEGFYKYH
ncbi:MAG: 3-hydroxyacyl-CoA dehydrogenase [Ndongobacter sp.]|nr:3-hydroxyacyl-CoA dehydrogenase [Ndongobacter sp.]